ncbi:MAG: right-handed parallel beta-helix repeat-containing protein [Candidatus Eisenbacteria bacterium]
MRSRRRLPALPFLLLVVALATYRSPARADFTGPAGTGDPAGGGSEPGFLLKSPTAAGPAGGETFLPSERARSRTWRIRPDGTGDAPTIQAGIDSATAGDTVLLDEGIFIGGGNRDIRFRGKAVIVRGKGDPDLHVIDCKGTPGDPHRGFLFESGEGPGSVLSSLTVTGGHTAGYGGGILCRNGSSPTLDNLIVRGNRADTRGGGMYCHGASAEIVECVFRANSSRSGGGIWGRRAFLRITGSLFEENIAGHQDYDFAGAIGCDSSDYLILEKVRFEANEAPIAGAVSVYITPFRATDCAFVGNTASMLCGAFFSFPVVGAYAVTLRGCEFTENSAVVSAGALALQGDRDTLSACSFTRNEANWGGALFLSGGDSRIEECSFIDNHARRSGGVLDIYGSASLRGCTIAGNTAADSGGVIHVSYAEPIELEGCTIAFNGAPHGGTISVPRGTGSSVILSRSIVAYSDSGEAVLCDGVGCDATLSCCDLYGNVGGDWVGFIAPQAGINGNLSENPLFCDEETNDFTLDADSPCLDAPGCGLVGAWGWGCGVPVGVAGGAGILPGTTYLGRGAPNPLNPSTTIRFGLARAGRVSLVIHDTAGRRVRILAREDRPAGEHAVTWDGRDAGGRDVASGVYLVRMETEGRSSARKVIILR